jgi:hypothetical protein
VRTFLVCFISVFGQQSLPMFKVRSKHSPCDSSTSFKYFRPRLCVTSFCGQNTESFSLSMCEHIILALVGVSASFFSCRELIRCPSSQSRLGLRFFLASVSAVSAFAAGVAVRGPLPLTPESTSYSLLTPTSTNPRNIIQTVQSCTNSWIVKFCGFVCRPFGFLRGTKLNSAKRLYTKHGLGEDLAGSGPNILIAVTGSVASVKIPELVLHFRRLSPGCRVKIIASTAGRRMLAKAGGYDAAAWRSFCALGIEILDDDDEW